MDSSLPRFLAKINISVNRMRRVYFLILKFHDKTCKMPMSSTNKKYVTFIGRKSAAQKPAGELSIQFIINDICSFIYPY